MTNIDEQRAFFTLIGETLKKKTRVWVIHGSAMLYLGLKDVTKDIDLVVDNGEVKKEIEKVLKTQGFKQRLAKMLYGDREDLPLLLQRGEERVDLFCKKVINMQLSDGIKSRATEAYEYGNLIVEVVSPEDIILLKSVTERAGDRLDALNIMERVNVNWQTIIDESAKQMELTHDMAPLSVYEFLCELKEDLNAEIPQEIIDQVGDICEEEFKKRGLWKGD